MSNGRPSQPVFRPGVIPRDILDRDVPWVDRRGSSNRARPRSAEQRNRQMLPMATLVRGDSHQPARSRRQTPDSTRTQPGAAVRNNLCGLQDLGLAVLGRVAPRTSGTRRWYGRLVGHQRDEPINLAVGRRTRLAIDPPAIDPASERPERDRVLGQELEIRPPVTG